MNPWDLFESNLPLEAVYENQVLPKLNQLGKRTRHTRRPSSQDSELNSPASTAVSPFKIIFHVDRLEPEIKHFRHFADKIALVDPLSDNPRVSFRKEYVRNIG